MTYVYFEIKGHTVSLSKSLMFTHQTVYGKITGP